MHKALLNRGLRCSHSRLAIRMATENTSMDLLREIGVPSRVQGRNSLSHRSFCRPLADPRCRLGERSEAVATTPATPILLVLCASLALLGCATTPTPDTTPPLIARAGIFPDTPAAKPGTSPAGADWTQLLGRQSTGAAPAPSSPAPRRHDAYALGPGDMVEIVVPDLQAFGDRTPTTCRLDDRGQVNLPVAGQVQLGGQTAAQAEKALQNHLRGRFLRHPSATVRLLEARTQRVFVLGEVHRPGLLKLRHDRCTLWNALSMAGGTNPQGDGMIVLVRGGATDQPNRYAIPLETLNRIVATGRDIPLVEGDVVNVGRKKRRYFCVWGLVRRPGVYEIPADTEIRITHALAMAGGIDPAAAPRHATLVRVAANGQEERVPLDLTAIAKGRAPAIVLRAGDEVTVQSTLGTEVRSFLSRVFRVYFTGGANFDLLSGD